MKGASRSRAEGGPLTRAAAMGAAVALSTAVSAGVFRLLAGASGRRGSQRAKGAVPTADPRTIGKGAPPAPHTATADQLRAEADPASGREAGQDGGASQMKRRPYRWSKEQKDWLAYALRLEWATLVLMGSVVLVMYLTLGNSQAMKVAWLEDMFGLVPAITFMVAHRFERRPPDDTHPFGYFKAITVAHLVAATALLFLALYMIYDSIVALVMLTHPTIGLVSVFGYELWMGWLMIAALTYSIIPPVVLGRLKRPVANALNDPVLAADGAMQQADWLTAAAAIVGIIGIGFGLWWADAVAALFISLDVLHDGWRHTRGAVRDLTDHVAMRQLGQGDEGDEIARVKAAVEALDWVDDVNVRFRNEGRLLTGEVFVRAKSGVATPERLAEARHAASEAHWRIYDPTVSLLDARDG